jgi:putative spermidine/putrescine transport system ATP-binding protein
MTSSASSRGGHDIEVVDVCKSYGGPNVVEHVDFELRRGELLTLLGPSGSGKSTSLLMVAGFERPTSGDIRARGESIVDLSPQHRNLGIVFQSYSLFPQLSALENVAFPLRMRRVPKETRRKLAMEMLEKVGLERFSDRRPLQLSGGQQQRVALARALVFEPDALLLDEPLGALDKRLRDRLQLEIKTIQRSLGISVLYITHDQDEAMMMSDRIAVMSDGRIQQIGEPEAIYSSPSNSFVAQFLGETNLLPCEITGGGQGYASVVYEDGTRGMSRADQNGGLDGPQALVSVRPERVRICAEEPTQENIVRGEIVETTFVGTHVRCVAHALGRHFVVRIGDPQQALAVKHRGDVWLAWSKDDAQLLAP